MAVWARIGSQADVVVWVGARGNGRAVIAKERGKRLQKEAAFVFAGR
jgi:hypothetical protein